MADNDLTATEPECSCFPVANPWTYYGIVEPGGALEQNPECAIHGDIAYLAGEVTRLRASLHAVATYKLEHRNMGECPAWPGDESRDPDCDVCNLLTRPAGGEG